MPPSTPTPHPNFWLSSWQLLFWRLWRPTLWRGHVAAVRQMGHTAERRWRWQCAVGWWPLAILLSGAWLGVAQIGLPYVGAGVAMGAVAGTLVYALVAAVAGPGRGMMLGFLAALVVGVEAGLWSAVGWDQTPPRTSRWLLASTAVLTFPLWRPWLTYPLLLVWNWLLHQQDKRNWRQGQLRHPTRLRWHSAFWDEQQRLALWGLDEYVVWVWERQPEEGRAALADLLAGRQRWAAVAAQIELDARQLERMAADITAIGRAHHQLLVEQMSGPQATLLRNFQRLSQDVEAALSQNSIYHKRLALRGVESRLENLLRELTRSPEPEAARFYPVANRWYETVLGTSALLAETAAQHDEIDNPYIFGVPLTEDQEIFVGRRDISERIEQLLRDPRRPPLLLYGQRRMGKTSLLRSLRRLLPSHMMPLFVDGEGLAGASSYADFLYNFGWQMRLSTVPRGLTLPELSREALADGPFTHFITWLDAVEQALTQQGHSMALLTLDEFEAVDAVLDKGRFAAEDVMRMLRHLIQHRPFFKILLAGSHSLTEFQHWASYLINVQVVKVDYLSLDEALQLITRPVPNFRLVYEREACAAVLGLTHGHPHLVQLLCYTIVSRKNEQPAAQRWLVNTADVEAAVPEALATGSFFFVDIAQNQVDVAGAAVLRWIAQQETAGEEPHPEGLDEQTAAEAVDALLQRDLITPLPQGGYRFQVELIRRWFASQG